MASLNVVDIVKVAQFKNRKVECVAVAGETILAGTSSGHLVLVQESPADGSFSVTSERPVGDDRKRIRCVDVVPEWDCLVCGTDASLCFLSLSNLQHGPVKTLKPGIVLAVACHARTGMVAFSNRKQVFIQRWRGAGKLEPVVAVALADVRRIEWLHDGIVLAASKSGVHTVAVDSGAATRTQGDTRSLPTLFKLRPFAGTVDPDRLHEQAARSAFPGRPAIHEPTLRARRALEAASPSPPGVVIARDCDGSHRALDAALTDSGTLLTWMQPPTAAVSAGPFVIAATASGVEVHAAATGRPLQQLARPGISHLAVGAAPLRATPPAGLARATARARQGEAGLWDPGLWGAVEAAVRGAPVPFVVAASTSELLVLRCRPVLETAAALAPLDDQLSIATALALCEAVPDAGARSAAKRLVHRDGGLARLAAGDPADAYRHLQGAGLRTAELLGLTPAFAPAGMRLPALPPGVAPVRAGPMLREQGRALARLLRARRPAVARAAAAGGAPDAEAAAAEAAAAAARGGVGEGGVWAPEHALERGAPGDPLALLDGAVARALLESEPGALMALLRRPQRCLAPDLEPRLIDAGRWDEAVQLRRSRGEHERALSLLRAVALVAVGTGCLRVAAAGDEEGTAGTSGDGGAGGDGRPALGPRTASGRLLPRPDTAAGAAEAALPVAARAGAGGSGGPGGPAAADGAAALSRARGLAASLRAGCPALRAASVPAGAWEAAAAWEGEAATRAVWRCVTLLQRLPPGSEGAVRRHAEWAVALWPRAAVRVFTGAPLDMATGVNISAGEAEADQLVAAPAEGAAATMPAFPMLDTVKLAALSRGAVLRRACAVALRLAAAPPADLRRRAAGAGSGDGRGDGDDGGDNTDGDGDGGDGDSDALGATDAFAGDDGDLARAWLAIRKTADPLPREVEAMARRAAAGAGGDDGSSVGSGSEGAAGAGAAESRLPAEVEALVAAGARRAELWEVNEWAIHALRARLGRAEAGTVADPDLHNELARLHMESVQAISRYLEKGRALARAGSAEGLRFSPRELREQRKTLRRDLQRFLDASAAVDADALLEAVPPTGFEHERALLHRLAGEHEQALSVYVHQLGNADKAERYCERFWDPKNPATADLYLSLLLVHLRPATDPRSGEVLGPAEARDGPATALPAAVPALLRAHADKLDPVAALEALPASTPLAAVADFVQRGMRSLQRQWRGAQVETRLRKLGELMERAALRDAERRHTVIGPARQCGACGRRIGTDAFAWYPNDVVVHRSCAKDLAVCPVAVGNP